MEFNKIIKLSTIKSVLGQEENYGSNLMLEEFCSKKELSIISIITDFLSNTQWDYKDEKLTIRNDYDFKIFWQKELKYYYVDTLSYAESDDYIEFDSYLKLSKQELLELAKG